MKNHFYWAMAGACSFFLAGCAATSPRTTDAERLYDDSALRKKISSSIANQRIAIVGKNVENSDKDRLCPSVIKEKIIDNLFRSIAPNVIAEELVTAKDFKVQYQWTCLNNTASATNTMDTQLSDSAGAVASIYTLGLLPSIPIRRTLKLDVEIFRNNKKLFKATYKEDLVTRVNFYSDQSMTKELQESSRTLAGHFLKELDREGPFEM